MAECEHEWTVRGYCEQIACEHCGRPKAKVLAIALRALVEVTEAYMLNGSGDGISVTLEIAKAKRLLGEVKP